MPPKTKKRATSTIRAAVADLDKRKKAIGAERDALYELRDTCEELASSCDDALEGIASATEALSRFV